MSAVELLWRLQGLDTSLQELEEEERGLPLWREVEGMEGELSLLLEETGEAERELEDLRERIRKRESAVEELSSRIAAEEERLYGGKVSNPKELRSIQAEVQSLKRKRDQEETGLLEMMERSEELEARLGGAGEPPLIPGRAPGKGLRRPATGDGPHQREARGAAHGGGEDARGYPGRRAEAL